VFISHCFLLITDIQESLDSNLWCVISINMMCSYIYFTYKRNNSASPFDSAALSIMFCFFFHNHQSWL
jgi:hypothetical protein